MIARFKVVRQTVSSDDAGHSDVKTTSTRYVKKNRRLQRDRQEGLFDDEIRRAARKRKANGVR